MILEECDELTDLIIQEADRIGERVNRLMDLVRPTPLRRSSVSLNLLVHDGVALLRADSTVRRVDWTLDLDPSLPRIEGDPGRLAEAVGNLLRNAAEAADQEVCVRTRLTPDGRFSEAGLDRGLALRLDVQDDGAGISEAAERDLFVPFATTKLEGSGLGLFVTRLAVEDHGGRLSVRPRPSRPEHSTGACFSMILFERLPPLRMGAEVEDDRGRRRPFTAPLMETHI
jgi:two-component system nitrogen regulation sensor histidine kinase GlnL